MNAEKLCTRAAVTIVGATGYAAGSTVAVFSKAYTTVGTFSDSGKAQPPGDCAALVRYATPAVTSKGRPVYLFNYYHGICMQGTPDADTLSTLQKTALETYATAWLTGFSDGTITAVRAGPNGVTASSRFVSPLVTHRDFPR